MESLVSALVHPDTRLIVVTGAGISVASGIPTFRGPDPDAIWANDILEKATHRYFVEDPVGSWSWYLKRFDGLHDAAPNPAHTSLAALETCIPLTLITQNIDGLHARAGSQHLIEVHGSAHRVRCAQPGCSHGAPYGSLPYEPEAFSAFRRAPSMALLPRCPSCNAPVRPHVLWFDEMYTDHEDYGFERVYTALEASPTCLLYVGTSFSVGVTDLLVRAGMQLGVQQFVLDPHLLEPPVRGMTLIRAPSEDVLPDLLERVQAHQG